MAAAAMSDASNCPRGSLWRKWDLHTHTPASILNNGFLRLADGKPDWESYVAALEQTDLAVLGVTDYFTIEGYKKLREYKSQGRLSNISCLLPNVEFRLDKIISSRRDGGRPRRLNFHVIFSDAVSPEIIEEHFLHDLDFEYEGHPQTAIGTRKLKVSNIRDLGNRLAKEHEAFADSNPLELGASKIVVSMDQILRALQDDRLKGRYLLVLPEELSSLIDWNGQDHQVRKVLLQQSDMVFSPNPKTRQWCLGRDPYAAGVDAYIEEFKSLKPCIHGADAHSLEELNRPCAKRSGKHRCAAQPTECDMRYLWVKADPTFDGLTQLRWEPDSRVYIGSSPPDVLMPELTIQSVSTVKLPWLLDSGIEINPGLVAVIGARGSGKTALLDLIAHGASSALPLSSTDSFLSRAAGHMRRGRVHLVWSLGETRENGFEPFSEEVEADVHYLSQQLLSACARPKGSTTS